MSARTRPDGCCTIPNPPAPPAGTDADRLVAIVKALGDPTRLGIVRLIAAQDAEIRACGITSRFDVRQSTISHRLRALRDAGLLTASRRGIGAHDAIVPAGMTVLREAVGAIAPALVKEVA